MHGPLSVLLGEEVLLGPTKEAWSSVLLSCLQGLLCQPWEEALKVWGRPLKVRPLYGHSVEDSLCDRDIADFHRDLLLSLSLLPLLL